MDVSKNRCTPKWMIYNGKPYQNWWFGGTIIFGNTHIYRAIAKYIKYAQIFIPLLVSPLRKYQSPDDTSFPGSQRPSKTIEPQELFMKSRPIPKHPRHQIPGEDRCQRTPRHLLRFGFSGFQTPILTRSLEDFACLGTMPFFLVHSTIPKSTPQKLKESSHPKYHDGPFQKVSQYLRLQTWLFGLPLEVQTLTSFVNGFWSRFKMAFKFEGLIS